MTPFADSADFDVVVIGYGPVGMTTAALLGRQGHRVLVLERYPHLYNLPRAGVFDDEIMRAWAGLGLSGWLLPRMTMPPRWQLENGVGEVLAEFDCAEVGRSGWAVQYSFYQPDLEGALDRLCRGLPGVEVRQGAPVVELTTTAWGAEVTVGGPEGPLRIRARYVVGCDGGNSFVREALGIGHDDLGFTAPWHVCDFRWRRKVELPTLRQVCGPPQPTVIIPLGPDHHRLAFMLGESDDVEAEIRPERVWPKVGPHLTEDNAELIRSATYIFRSRVAKSWRSGPVLLAGDAAHEMPPHLGQGMCSGIRDAYNLAFKLDLVLRARAHPDLLDTYQQEREPHVRAVLELAIERGRAHTMRDPVAAAERDRRMLAQRGANQRPPQVRFPDLGVGFLAARSGPGRGELSVHGFVDGGAGRDRLDAVVGTGFHFLVVADLLGDLERSGIADDLRAAGVKVVGIGDHPDGAHTVADVDGTYRRWFGERGWVAGAVRPDFYVYGSALDGSGTHELAADLLVALGAKVHSLGT